MKYIAWILVLIIAGVASWQYVVNKEDRIASNNAYNELEKKFADTLKDYDEFKEFTNSMVNNANIAAIEAGKEAQQSKHWLDVRQKRIKALLSLLDSTEKETPDSTWVQVSPRYKDGCDSLRKNNGLLNEQIGKYEQDNQAHVDALGYETLIRDSIIQKERSFTTAFREQLAYCIKSLGEAEKKKQKSQLYAGMAAWGNQFNPLGGAEINLGLKTKNDQFYEIKGAYLGTLWIGIGIKFKISLKK